MLASTSHRAVARLAELALPGQVSIGCTVTEPVRRLSSGVAGLDAVLDGGVPRGRVSELLGRASSGKTSLLLAFLATATQGGEITAYVDLGDALHPESAAGAGVDLRRLLWVRPPSATDGLRCTELLLQAGGFAAVALDLGPAVGVGSAGPACGPEPSADGPLPFGSLGRTKSDRRIGAAVWPRLQHAAERSHTALIILGVQPVAGSCAVLRLALQSSACRWHRGTPRGQPLFEGFQSAVRVERNKLGQLKAESPKLKVQMLSAFRLI